MCRHGNDLTAFWCTPAPDAGVVIVHGAVRGAGTSPTGHRGTQGLSVLVSALDCAGENWALIAPAGVQAYIPGLALLHSIQALQALGALVLAVLVKPAAESAGV